MKDALNLRAAGCQERRFEARRFAPGTVRSRAGYVAALTLRIKSGSFRPRLGQLPQADVAWSGSGSGPARVKLAAGSVRGATWRAGPVRPNGWRSAGGWRKGEAQE